MPKPESHKDFYWYHSIDLGNGVVTDGDYDVSDQFDHYGIPADMTGMDVLDVGRGSGAFAFEFARRGGRVVATEIRSFLDWDFVGGDIAGERLRRQIDDLEAFSKKHIYGAFEYANQVKGSIVEGKFINIYDLCPDAFDGKRFDLVFAGSVLGHLRDSLRALARRRTVTKSVCIVATPAIEIRRRRDLPFMTLVGTADPDRRTWWLMNPKALIESLVCVGFARAQLYSEFVLRGRKRRALRSRHIVVHAWV